MNLVWMTLSLLLIVVALVWMSGWARKRSKDPDEEAEMQSFKPKRQLDVDSSLLFKAKPAPANATPCYLVIDTETTELGGEDRLWRSEWIAPKPIAIAWQVLDVDLNLIEECTFYIKRYDAISKEAKAVHGIEEEQLQEQGEDPKVVYSTLLQAVKSCQVLVAHNLLFHRKVIECDLDFWQIDKSLFSDIQGFCTMHGGIDYAHLTDEQGNWKLPKLTELFGMLYFGRSNVRCSFSNKAIHDVRLVAACIRRMHLPFNSED